MSISSVAVERHDLISARPFDDVLATVCSGLGRPDFPALVARLETVEDWDTYRAAVDTEAGSSGLMVFLELDLGAVVGRDPDAPHFRAVRIIAGNPVTMELMVRSTPQAGAAAPVTLLMFERPDGVHLRYDTAASLAGPELTAEATTVAHALDRAVLSLLRAAV